MVGGCLGSLWLLRGIYKNHYKGLHITGCKGYVRKCNHHLGYITACLGLYRG